jgi:putative peptidoglycan lipid II flippase
LTKSVGQRAAGKGAFLVGLGVFASRIFGLIRARVIAHYFGLGAVNDAVTAAFRIPNVLQNLFGDQALSASFIPVYASLLAKDEGDADRLAGAVASLLALVIAVLVLVGVLAAPVLIPVIAPGFTGARRELTVALVRVLFPGIGLLVLSAWCLGVLNSHHRFLLSYSAPIVWNVAMIATLLVYGRSYGTSEALPRLAELLAWGAVAGSALQFAVQLPTVFKVAPGLRFAIDLASEHVRTVVRNFVPVFVSRGIVQLSNYIDQIIATWLPIGGPSAIQNATLLSTLPVSLFGMAVSAAELPAMSRLTGNDEEKFAHLRLRLDSGLRQIAFFVVPSAVAFLAFGDVVAAALFQTGRFQHGDTVYVWQILAGSAVGLLASTLGRLYSSTFYALRDTRTPLNYALVRVATTTALGYFCALPLPRMLGVNPAWGAAGLTASAGVAGWIEMLMLRRTMNARIGKTGLPASFVVRLWASAIAGAAVAWGLKLTLPRLHPILSAVVILGPYGLIYFGSTAALKVPEAARAVQRLLGGRARDRGQDRKGG